MHTMFNTNDMNIIRFCQTQFDIHLPSELLTKRTNKFEVHEQFDIKYKNRANFSCQMVKYL